MRRSGLMKVVGLFLGISLILGLTATSQAKKPNPAEENIVPIGIYSASPWYLKLTPDPLIIPIGGSGTVYAEIVPSYADDTFTFPTEVKDAKGKVIAEVANVSVVNGKAEATVTSVRIGTGTMTVSSHSPTSGESPSASITISIFGVEIKAEDGESDPPEYIPVGGITKFKAKVLPKELTGKFKWQITKGKKYAEIAAGADEQTVSVKGLAPSVTGEKKPKIQKVKLKLMFKPTGATDWFNVDEHEFVIFGVEIWDYLPFYILINRPWILKAHPIPDLGDGYVWDTTANATISDPKLKDIQLTGTGPSSDPTTDWVRVKYTPPGALEPAEASIKLTVQVPSDLKEIAADVASDGTMGEFSYQVLDQNKKDAPHAGMTALETIPSLHITISNYNTGALLKTEVKPDPVNVPVDDTNADGEFTDTPIGATPQGMVNARNSYRVDVKVTTVRDKTYSIIAEGTTYPSLATFRQTIIQTAIKRGNKIVTGNEGVFETRL